VVLSSQAEAKGKVVHLADAYELSKVRIHHWNLLTPSLRSKKKLAANAVCCFTMEEEGSISKLQLYKSDDCSIRVLAIRDDVFAKMRCS
jgi:hypothetical protein